MNESFFKWNEFSIIVILLISIFKEHRIQKELHFVILRKGNHICAEETSIKATEI